MQDILKNVLNVHKRNICKVFCLQYTTLTYIFQEQFKYNVKCPRKGLKSEFDWLYLCVDIDSSLHICRVSRWLYYFIDQLNRWRFSEIFKLSYLEQKLYVFISRLLRTQSRSNICQIVWVFVLMQKQCMLRFSYSFYKVYL